MGGSGDFARAATVAALPTVEEMDAAGLFGL